MAMTFLHRPTQLQTDKVRIGIDPERMATVQQMGEIVGEIIVGRGNRDGGRHTGSQLLGEGGAGDDRQRHLVTQHLAGHILQQAATVRLQPLGGPGDTGIGAQEGFYLSQHLAEYVARHNQQQYGGSLYRTLQIRSQLQISRKRDIRQKCLVATILFQLGEMGRVMTPQQGRMTVARQRNGKGGAVRPRPQDRDSDLVSHYQASAVACWA